jgi:signal transduction histidine kinase
MSTYFDQIVAKVEETRADVDKAEEGNKAATSRVRKSMQEIKALAQDLRKEMLELRDSGGNKAAS